MSISLEAIVTGMNGGPEAIQQNFNKIKAELERMNGSVVEIPKEQFTTLNGFSVDRNACKGLIFKFDSFAIIYFQSYIGNVTLKGWTFKEALAIPKSYLGGFTKFASFGVGRRISDDANNMMLILNRIKQLQPSTPVAANGIMAEWTLNLQVSYTTREDVGVRC